MYAGGWGGHGCHQSRPQYTRRTKHTGLNTGAPSEGPRQSLTPSHTNSKDSALPMAAQLSSFPFCASSSPLGKPVCFLLPHGDVTGFTIGRSSPGIIINGRCQGAALVEFCVSRSTPCYHTEAPPGRLPPASTQGCQTRSAPCARSVPSTDLRDAVSTKSGIWSPITQLLQCFWCN